jgi:hypothetical protein
MPMAALSEDDPSPFKQPFLELVIKGDVARQITPNCPFWLVDVDGKIDTYISKENKPKAPLIRLCRTLAKAGIVVTQFGRYTGSAGPHVVMRNGVLFYRMGNIENVPPEVLAFAYRTPIYRGP